LNTVKLFIASGTTMYEPVIIGKPVWTTTRKGEAGKLEFTVLKDSTIRFEEGDVVKFSVDGADLFYGYVFQKGSSKSKQIDVVAYDQIRYLKNKDTYIYSNKTASQFLRMVAADYGLKTGTIEDTRFVIPDRVEENSTLLDMIQTALEITLSNSRIMYVLYDQAGKLTLRSLNNMRVGALMDADTIEDYDYSTSIDKETYNRVKLVQEDKETGNRNIYIAEDRAGNMKKWGTLQLFETVNEETNVRHRAEMMLALYNAKSRSLTIKNQLGDLRIRAGSLPIVKLQLEDMTIDGYMLVEKCRHIFGHGEHFMDLTLKGGEFYG
jgi:hypothetical protein